MANLTCKLGAAAWDAIPFVRNMIEDATTPFLVPDTALQYYVETAAEEFSRLLPLDEVVGNPYTNVSPFNSVANQQRYVCSVANGFAVAPTRITGVLWRSTALYTNLGLEFSYLSMSIASPVAAFASDWLDTPTFRVLRSEYLTELERFGKGTYGIIRDRATGLLAIDLWPVPNIATQIFARYQAQHVDTGTGTDRIYLSVPDDMKMHFARLLLAEVMDQEADRIAKQTHGQAGFLQMTSSPRDLRASAMDMRERVQTAMEAHAGMVITT